MTCKGPQARYTRESEDDHDSSCPEFTGREYEDSDGGSDTSSNE
jgi:hypothetical protein